MTEDPRHVFLSKIGKEVYEPREVEVGNILGWFIGKSPTFQLSYAKSVSLNPTGLKFNFFPYVIMMGTEFFFKVSKCGKLVGYKGVSMNPEHSAGKIWEPAVISTHLSEKIQADQKEFLEELPEMIGESKRMYVIEDDKFKKIGQRIPELELPSLNFLPQSTHLDGLLKMLDNSADERKTLRRAADDLRKAYGLPKYD